MTTQTWAQIVNLALRDSGVAAAGQSPSPQMQQDCVLRLNMMIGQWKRRRWMVYHLVDVFCPCTGAQSYGIGPGLDLDTPRTDQLDSVFIRQVISTQPNQVDYPLTRIPSREDYNRIALKRLTASPPDSYFFDSGFPTGAIFPFPIPNSNWELHASVKAELDSVVNLTDTVNLPDEYQEAIYSNLYMRLCSGFRLSPDPTMAGIAKKSMATIKSANTQIGILRMPAGIRARGRSYNVFSDR